MRLLEVSRPQLHTYLLFSLSLSFGAVLRPQPSLHWWPVYCGPFSFGVRLCSNQSSGLDAFSSCRSRTGNDITRHIIVPAIADPAIIIPAIVEPAIVEPLQPAKVHDPYYAHPFRVLSPGAPQPSPPGQDHSGRTAPQLLSGEVVKGQKGEPDTLGTALGYVLVGQHTASTGNTNLSQAVQRKGGCGVRT